MLHTRLAFNSVTDTSNTGADLLGLDGSNTAAEDGGTVDDDDDVDDISADDASADDASADGASASASSSRVLLSMSIVAATQSISTL